MLLSFWDSVFNLHPGEDMTSSDIVERFQRMPQLERTRIGALVDLSGFTDVAHVIYIINVRGGSKREPLGDCACLIVKASGSISLELSASLYDFWNYWERQPQLNLTQLSRLADEVAHFFRHQEPSHKTLYYFKDGKGNERIHRTMRSIEKCSHLQQVFGYELVASES